MNERSPEAPASSWSAADLTPERRAYRAFIEHYGRCASCQASETCGEERGLWQEYRRLRDENRTAAQ